MTPPPARQRLSALALLLVLSGCASAEPPTPPPVPAYRPHPAIAIVDRLSGTGDQRLPDLEGLSAEEAVAALAHVGLRAQVVAYDEGPVSAQHPEPGAPPPADGRVVVWTGAPPTPPPPPRVSRDLTRADTRADEGQPHEVPPQAEPTPDPPAEPPSAASPTPTPQTAHPPRTNPRRLAATEEGTVLDGLASWYGPGFAGRTTACGQTFDPAGFTLATRELRCGTRVLVTGPGGRTVEAVATDWGPAEWTGRRFDLSRATFAAIHHLSAGVVAVTVEVLP